MSIYKRGGVYWYKFQWKGKLVRESTKQGNDKGARQIESAHRTSLAKGEVGIREKKIVPTLAEFVRSRFLPWAESVFAAKPKTWLWYRNGMRRLISFAPLADLRLTELTGESVASYVAHRQSGGLEVSSINRELQVLRRMLHLAVEWGVIDAMPKIGLLAGERHGERVVTLEEEAKYLAAAPEPLASIAAVLADTGMRPDECFRLCWEAIMWLNGRYGSLLVTDGKTNAARRVLPMTPRVRAILESRWEGDGKPAGGWVWSAPTNAATSNLPASKNGNARL
jgi:integrase